VEDMSDETSEEQADESRDDGHDMDESVAPKVQTNEISVLGFSQKHSNALSQIPVIHLPFHFAVVVDTYEHLKKVIDPKSQCSTGSIYMNSLDHELTVPTHLSTSS
jgi:hypothetical protein